MVDFHAAYRVTIGRVRAARLYVAARELQRAEVSTLGARIGGPVLAHHTNLLERGTHVAETGSGVVRGRTLGTRIHTAVHRTHRRKGGREGSVRAIYIVEVAGYGVTCRTRVVDGLIHLLTLGYEAPKVSKVGVGRVPPVVLTTTVVGVVVTQVAHRVGNRIGNLLTTRCIGVTRRVEGATQGGIYLELDRSLYKGGALACYCAGVVGTRERILTTPLIAQTIGLVVIYGSRGCTQVAVHNLLGRRSTVVQCRGVGEPDVPAPRNGILGRQTGDYSVTLLLASLEVYIAIYIAYIRDQVVALRHPQPIGRSDIGTRVAVTLRSLELVVTRLAYDVAVCRTLGAQVGGRRSLILHIERIDLACLEGSTCRKGKRTGADVAVEVDDRHLQTLTLGGGGEGDHSHIELGRAILGDGVDLNLLLARAHAQQYLVRGSCHGCIYGLAIGERYGCTTCQGRLLALYGDLSHLQRLLADVGHDNLHQAREVLHLYLRTAASGGTLHHAVERGYRTRDVGNRIIATHLALDVRTHEHRHLGRRTCGLIVGRFVGIDCIPVVALRVVIACGHRTRKEARLVVLLAEDKLATVGVGSLLTDPYLHCVARYPLRGIALGNGARLAEVGLQLHLLALDLGGRGYLFVLRAGCQCHHREGSTPYIDLFHSLLCFRFRHLILFPVVARVFPLFGIAAREGKTCFDIDAQKVDAWCLIRHLLLFFVHSFLFRLLNIDYSFSQRTDPPREAYPLLRREPWKIPAPGSSSITHTCSDFGRSVFDQ